MLGGRRHDSDVCLSVENDIAVDDRGLTYGDGVFETCAVVDGQVCLWSRHLQRLTDACERLRLPMRDADGLYAAVLDILRETRRAVLKIIVTRGVGGRGYRLPEKAVPTWLARVSSWPYDDTRTLRSAVDITVCTTLAPISPSLAGLKHLGRLENVLARAEWAGDDFFDGLMLDAHGLVIEATQCNVFVEIKGKLITPLLTQSGVAGVVRGLVLDIASEQGKPVVEKSVRLNDVISADAVYLTNSLIGVQRVRSVNDHRYRLDHPVNASLQLAQQRVFTTEP